MMKKEGRGGSRDKEEGRGGRRRDREEGGTGRKEGRGEGGKKVVEKKEK